MLSVIIPVYNEIGTIKEILDKVNAVPIPKEIIVIDDHSIDGTREFLKNLKEPELKIIFQNRNYGKGRAVREGIAFASGDIIIIQDADLEYDPRDFVELIRPIQLGLTKVVYGSRWLGHHFNEIPLNIFVVGRWLLTALANLLYKTNITDEPCGYKVFAAEVIRGIPLSCEKFEFCPEITAKLAKGGYKIYEVPIRYYPRTHKEGKKISFFDGIQAAFTLLKYKFQD